MVEERPLATDRFRESQNPDEFSEQPGTDLESRLRDNPRKASALDHSIRIGIAALSDIAKALSGIAGQVLPFLGLLCPEILAEALKRRYQETSRPIQFADAIQLALTLMALRVPYSGPEPRPDGIIGAIRDYEMIASYALRHNHILELITASSSNPVAFSALQEALRWLREDGKDIPDDLREWSYDVAQGTRQCPKVGPGRSRYGNQVRDAAIVNAIETLVDCGLKPTRNQASDPNSASDAVSMALKRLGLNLESDAIAKIWAKRDQIPCSEFSSPWQ